MTFTTHWDYGVNDIDVEPVLLTVENIGRDWLGEISSGIKVLVIRQPGWPVRVSVYRPKGTTFRVTGRSQS